MDTASQMQLKGMHTRMHANTLPRSWLGVNWEGDISPGSVQGFRGSCRMFRAHNVGFVAGAAFWQTDAVTFCGRRSIS